MHKFNYKWKISDGYPAPGIEKHGCTVFSTFSCGGGSSMGYKLAGYNVIGAEDIDPRMQEIYEANHHPKYYILDGIKTMKDRDDLPEELYNLDVLDGSPPCSNFSMAGNREKDWGKEKKFREGQSNQVLDTLFFDFIDLAKKLQPKVVIAENVKGLLMGNAVKYVKRILKEFDEAGYVVKYYLLNSKTMGVPQARERVFFIAIRKDLSKKIETDDLFNKSPNIDMYFDEDIIPIKDFVKGKNKKETQHYSKNRYGDVMLNLNNPSNTITTDINRYWIDEKTLVDDESISLIGSFPLDYNYCGQHSQYVIGMSVPPIMMAQVAYRVYKQVLSKLK